MKLRKSVFIIFMSGILCLFSSCTTDLILQINEDGSLKISLTSKAGEAISHLIPSFDTANFSSDMENSGFSEVSFSQKKVSDTQEFFIEMKENSRNTYLFSSGMITLGNENQISVNITPETLIDFYNSADSQTVYYLDLFLAPIFNNEVMSKNEYLEMLESVYGQKVAEEIKSSYINIKIINQNGKAQSGKISIAELMTLQKPIKF